MWTQTHAAVPKTCSPGQSRFRHRKETCSRVRGAFEAGELSQAALWSCRAGGGVCSSRCPQGTANPSPLMWPNIPLISALNTELGAETPNAVLVGLLLSCSRKELAAPGGPSSAHKPLPHPPSHMQCVSLLTLQLAGGKARQELCISTHVFSDTRGGRGRGKTKENRKSKTMHFQRLNTGYTSFLRLSGPGCGWRVPIRCSQLCVC